jgi:hypothetical protein
MTHVHAHAMAHEHRHPERLETDPGLAESMGRAAGRWLELLSAAQRRLALWAFDTTQRGDWHYAPRQREGLPLRHMDRQQQEAAYALLESGLSQRGYLKARSIMALESILAEIEQGRSHIRDPLNYAFTLFGTPGSYPWGWRIEGHHLIINATVAARNAVTITPTFWGTNPARIPIGPREGERIQAREYHLGLELGRSLDGDQRQIAVFQSHSVGNIIAERGRAQALQTPTGLPFARLSEGQRDLVMTLVDEYVGNASDGLGVPYLARVRESGLDQLHLSWAGGMHEGEAFYYRLHAPRLLIEFDCTQDNANHIHSLWRDPTTDWGRDLLGEHYHHHHDDD